MIRESVPCSVACGAQRRHNDGQQLLNHIALLFLCRRSPPAWLRALSQALFDSLIEIACDSQVVWREKRVTDQYARCRGVDRMAKDKGKAKGDPKVKEDGKTKEDSKAKDGKGEKPRNYSAFVLNKVRYNVGDAVLVQAANGGKDYVGTVTKIMASPSDHKNVQLMINWYYRPEVRRFVIDLLFSLFFSSSNDLISPSKKDVNGGKREYHGENELLRSDHRDTIHVGTINGPCKIYKFEDFQANEEKILEEAEDPDNVFYWREHYDYKKGLIRVRAAGLGEGERKSLLDRGYS